MRIYIVPLLAAMGMLAQDAYKPADITGKEQPAIISVKTLSGDSFNRLSGMLRVFNVRYSADEKLRTILVYAQPEVVAQIKKVVEELDRPGSEAARGLNIDMTLTFLRCSTKAQSGEALPADLEAVAKQLRAATQYKSIELWDIIPVRMQEGKNLRQDIRLPGSLPDFPGAINQGTLTIHPEGVIRKDTGRYIRFDRFQINLTIPYVVSRPGPTQTGSFNRLSVSLQTSGEFKEGQKTVVGKLSGSEDETAAFVVVSLKVLD